MCSGFWFVDPTTGDTVRERVRKRRRRGRKAGGRKIV